MAERTQEWRDISTAPKDGTMIMLYPVYRGYRRSGEPFASAAYWHQPGNPASKGFWVAVWLTTQKPTHWMPMLAPPNPVDDATLREAARDMKADMYGENGNG